MCNETTKCSLKETEENIKHNAYNNNNVGFKLQFSSFQLIRSDKLFEQTQVSIVYELLQVSVFQIPSTKQIEFFLQFQRLIMFVTSEDTYYKHQRSAQVCADS